MLIQTTEGEEKNSTVKFALQLNRILLSTLEKVLNGAITAFIQKMKLYDFEDSSVNNVFSTKRLLDTEVPIFANPEARDCVEKLCKYICFMTSRNVLDGFVLHFAEKKGSVERTIAQVVFEIEGTLSLENLQDVNSQADLFIYCSTWRETSLDFFTNLKNFDELKPVTDGSQSRWFTSIGIKKDFDSVDVLQGCPFLPTISLKKMEDVEVQSGNSSSHLEEGTSRTPEKSMKDVSKTCAIPSLMPVASLRLYNKFAMNVKVLQSSLELD